MLLKKNYQIVFVLLMFSVMLSSYAGLTKQQLQTISNAKKHFIFKSVNVNTLHGLKTVVIAGESHFKLRWAHESGLNLIKDFHFRAIEGDSYTINQLNKEWLSKDKSPYFSEKFLGLVKGSSIEQALLDGVTISNGGTIYYNLDKQGKIDDQLNQNFSSLLMYSKVYIEKLLNPIHDKNNLIPINISISYGEKAHWFKKCYEQFENILDAVDQCDWNVNVRNLKLTSNILTILNEFPELDSLLVIVGAIHVEGISEMLKNPGTFYYTEEKSILEFLLILIKTAI